MVEKDLVWVGKLKHKGIFNYKELYRYMYVWLIDKEYLVIEKEYTEKIGPNGKEVVVKWEARRKISDYFRFVFLMEWRILGMKEVEAMEDGAKITLDKGDSEIKVQAILEKDYENRWENSSFFKFLRTAYDRYLIRGRIDKYETMIYNEVNEYLYQMKSFLSLEGQHQF